MPLSFGSRYLYCAFTRKLAILSSSFCVYGVILSLLRRAVKMALERHNCQTTRYVSLACLRMQTGADCTSHFIIKVPVYTVSLKLPHLACQPFDAVFVLPRQIVDFLHGIVDLLHIGRHFVQAASIVP